MNMTLFIKYNVEFTMFTSHNYVLVYFTQALVLIYNQMRHIKFSTLKKNDFISISSIYSYNFIQKRTPRSPLKVSTYIDVMIVLN